MAISEKALELKLLRACKKSKIIIIKGDSRNNGGFPDRIIFNYKMNIIHYVELKNETYYKQTVLQKRWQNIIESSGGKYFLINGDTELTIYIDTFIKELKSL
jgi:hypothetical protein